MDQILKPAADWELRAMMAALAEQRAPVEVIGSGTKRDVGRPVAAAVMLTTTSLRGIPLYEPSELVMTARAGTPVSQIEVELASRGQMLAFEPIDHAAMFGRTPGTQTIGSVFATNNSGARRIIAGSARDHLLGVQAVNGRAEQFKSGGRVMKNVTGYDVARGVTGSWGTLAVLTDVTFKVLPMADDTLTLLYPGMTDELAVELMCAALGTPYEVSGTVHLPAAFAVRIGIPAMKAATVPVTAIRIENFMKSVVYRKTRLIEELAAYGKPSVLDLDNSLTFWSDLRRMTVLPAADTIVWRISTSPTIAPRLVATIRRHMHVDAMYDWSGGLVWLETPPSADAGAADIRRAVAIHGGHATLIRAPEPVRRSVDVFQPLAPAVERLTRGLKTAFDPMSLLNPGRMYATL